jgi:HNH endonuclease
VGGGMIEIPEEMRQALSQLTDVAVLLIDPTTQARFVLIREEEYNRLDRAQRSGALTAPNALAQRAYSFDPIQKIREAFPGRGEIRLVPDAEGFAVSDEGEIFSFRDLLSRPQNGKVVRIKTQQNKKDGYLRYLLRFPPGKKAGTLSRLVLQVFCPRDNYGGMHARHIDGNPKNNAITNLEWGTVADNMRDRDSQGRNPYGGTRNPKAKLTPEKVKEIRELIRRGTKTEEIASLFGVGLSAIRNIKSGETWANVR